MPDRAKCPGGMPDFARSATRNDPVLPGREG